MTAYRNGTAFELRVKADLERDGYVVIRSAGSKGEADLWASKVGQLLLIQCKRSAPLLPPRERRALLNTAYKADALALVAFMPGVRGIAYRRLTGTGPRDFVAWTADEVTV